MLHDAFSGTPGDTAGASALHRSELEFRRLLDKLPAAAYTCDPDGLITFYNRHAIELWGRAPKIRDPEDRYCGSFRLWSPEGSPIAHEGCWMALALRDNREYNGREIVIERSDGGRLTALAHANPIHDDEGRLLGAVNVLIDITDRKRAEEVLKEADRAKDEFLATLAHELRNPLAPIRNALAIMKDAKDDGEVVAKARGMIERQLEQLVRLVDDLLDVSRITSNKLRLHKEKVELAPTVATAVESCCPFLDSRGQKLVVSLPDEPVYLEADAVRLSQILLNLLDNAAKYSERDSTIRLTAERREEEVVLSVRDDGIGIPPELLAKIFEPFAQADHSLERSQSGLGLGLTLVRQLVELHGGAVEAVSEGPGRGSELVVRLPVAPSPSIETPAEMEGHRDGPAARRVLVVDDNRDSATSLALWLEMIGNEAHTAYDGEAAVAAAAELEPEVILLDIAMPRLNGYDAARRIRQEPWGREILLVAMTGWGQEEDRRRSREAGFDHHLVKPVDLRALEEILASLGNSAVDLN